MLKKFVQSQNYVFRTVYPLIYHRRIPAKMSPTTFRCNERLKWSYFIWHYSLGKVHSLCHSSTNKVKNKWVIRMRSTAGLNRVGIKAYSSQRVFFQQRRVLEYFYRGDVSVYVFTCLKLDYLIAHDVCDHIIAELRRERLDLALVSYRLFYQRIFVFDMTYFM